MFGFQAAIAHMVIGFMVKEIVADGAKVDWTSAKNRFDGQLQQLIHYPWIEHEAEAVVNPILDAFALASQDAEDLNHVLNRALEKDWAGAGAALVDMIRKVAPQVAAIFPTQVVNAVAA